MKKLVAILAFSLTSLALTIPAHAGILIEPYLGYALTGEADNGTQKNDLSGLAYGARFGVTNLGFRVGAELMGTQFEIDGAGNRKLNSTNVGVFAGYKLPILLQAYATYFFYNQAKYEFTGGSQDFRGSGMKVGVGYTGFPFISLNAEYLMQTYKEGKSGSQWLDLANDFKGSAFMLTVSAPFDLL